MKNILLIALALTLFNCSDKETEVHKTKIINQLQEFESANNYFKLKALFDASKDQLCENHALYYDAIIENVFYKKSAWHRKNGLDI